MKIRESLYRILIKVLIGIIILIVVGTVAFVVLQVSGRNRLYKKSNAQAPNLTQVRLEEAEGASGDASEEAPEPEEDWQEGDVRYQGVHYRYNEDILTFLFLGIDEKGEVKKKENNTEGGQSDAIFLLVLNPHTKEASVIGVNRDTMTDIEVYSKGGAYMGTATGQLTLQHAYGDGMELSCERSRDAVSRLFYDLPIHGYCSINMGAISLINDAVGGVELTALEDIPHTSIKEGQTIQLDGDEAYAYIHNRDINSFNSAGRRLERQKQYLTAYAAKAMAAMKEDITLPVKLYSKLSKYMVTDVTIDEVSYLATEVVGYIFDSEHIYSLEGETLEGEKFEEFYVDETALYELILEVFYEEVN